MNRASARGGVVEEFVASNQATFLATLSFPGRSHGMNELKQGFRTKTLKKNRSSTPYSESEEQEEDEEDPDEADTDLALESDSEESGSGYEDSDSPDSDSEE